MLFCECCGLSDRVMVVEGVALCWVCRRVTGIKEALQFRQVVRDNITQQSAFFVYSRPAKILIVKEVRELWERERHSGLILS